jgi:parvulin-like peptidyl-prolyl isomerase
VREKINAGADFAELAAKVSDDPDFASQGGMLTKNNKPDLPSGNFPAEERIAAGLKDGEVSEVLDAGDWFVIIQRLGYRPPQVQSFEDASERAEALCYAEKLKQRKRDLFEKLKDESYIEVMQKDPPAHLLKDVKNTAGDFLPPDK